MTQLDIACSRCGQPLIEIDFNRSYYLRTCNNWKCLLYRAPRGSRAKSLDPEILLRKEINLKRRLRPSYQAYQEKNDKRN